MPDIAAIGDTVLDGDRDVAGKLRAVLDVAVGGEAIATTCGELGDAIGEDGRKVVHHLKSLDDYDVERTEREAESGASIWRIDRLDDPADEFDAAIDGRTDDEFAPKVVRDCADSVESVQALADLLEVSEERARGLVHEHDIDLPDRPPRPGVDR